MSPQRARRHFSDLLGEAAAGTCNGGVTVWAADRSLAAPARQRGWARGAPWRPEPARLRDVAERGLRSSITIQSSGPRWKGAKCLRAGRTRCETMFAPRGCRQPGTPHPRCCRSFRACRSPHPPCRGDRHDLDRHMSVDRVLLSAVDFAREPRRPPQQEVRRGVVCSKACDLRVGTPAAMAAPPRLEPR